MRTFIRTLALGAVALAALQATAADLKVGFGSVLGKIDVPVRPLKAA